MSWNHRVMVKTVGKEKWFDMREVYYNGRGKPTMFTENAVSPGGSTIEELREELIMMLRATYNPVFEESEIPIKLPKVKRNG